MALGELLRLVLVQVPAQRFDELPQIPKDRDAAARPQPPVAPSSTAYAGRGAPSGPTIPASKRAPGAAPVQL
jgi:hypothetical protein